MIIRHIMKNIMQNVISALIDAIDAYASIPLALSGVGAANSRRRLGQVWALQNHAIFCRFRLVACP
jgi:hypothetical protein